MKIVIIGGVAGGMSAATRLRRLMEDAEIVVMEKPFCFICKLWFAFTTFLAKSQKESNCLFKHPKR